MDEDGGLAVVRPTRWKTRDDHLVKENADPSEATGGKLSLGSRDDDDADHDDVNMDDVSREWDERVVREDDAAFDQLLDLAEGAMHSVRLKASPAKTEPRETEDDDDDDDEGSEVDEYDEYDEYDVADDVADDRAAEMEHDASEANSAHSARENSDVSASSSFDFDVDEPDADDRGGARTSLRGFIRRAVRARVLAMDARLPCAVRLWISNVATLKPKVDRRSGPDSATGSHSRQLTRILP